MIQASIRRDLCTHAASVWHRCGKKMMALDSYLEGNRWASSWWCLDCLVSIECWGDENHPNEVRP